MAYAGFGQVLAEMDMRNLALVTLAIERIAFSSHGSSTILMTG